MNELTLSSTNAPTKFSFKNAKLNEISAKIAEQSAAMNSVYNAAKDGAEAINKVLAPLFGELLKTKCFKEDGFKSVADYAEQTFAMSKSMAYMLARVGEQFYSDNSDCTVKARETLSTSKLAELTNTDRVAIAKAIDDGELSSDSSLITCRDFATAHKKPGKEKVVPTFTVSEMHSKSVIAENVIKEDMFEAVAEAFATVNDLESPAAVMFAPAKMNGDKASAAQHFVAYDNAGNVEMFEFRPYVAKKATTKGKGKDVSRLKDMLAAMSPAERLELLKSLDGSADE